MAIWDTHCLSGKVSRLPVRPKMFLWRSIDFTSCRQDISPRPQRPHESIKRIITRKMVIIFIEHLLCTGTKGFTCDDPSGLELCDEEVPHPPHTCVSIFGESE